MYLTLWNAVLDVCREAAGEIFHSCSSVCGFVLLWLNEWSSFCLVKVNLLNFIWLKVFYLGMFVVGHTFDNKFCINISKTIHHTSHILSEGGGS